MTEMMPPHITRRPFAFWAACAVLLIFVSSAVALFAATYLADVLLT